MDISWLFIVVQLIFLEGLLSIDNAAVLGAMVAPLPNEAPIPWPNSLAWLGQKLDPLLGGQQDAALKVGLLGAYVGRGMMLLIAHQIVRYPWLQVVGGVYLIYLGIEHLGLTSQEGAGDHSQGRAANDKTSFWQVVVLVELADLVFSLDNVVAAVALSDRLWVVLLGVALGILALRWAASIFAVMVEREPILHHAAYALVLVIGLRFCLEAWLDFEISSLMQFGVSVGILALALLYAHWQPLRSLQPLVYGSRRIAYELLAAVKYVVLLRWAIRT